jgi:flagellar motor switch protein FliM
MAQDLPKRGSEQPEPGRDPESGRPPQEPSGPAGIPLASPPKEGLDGAGPRGAFPEASAAASGFLNEANLGEVLSQSEVERLLTQVQAEETSATVVGQDGHKERLKQEEVQPFDFRQPAFLTGGELRKIRLRHEEFIRSMAARLSIYLRLEVVVQMSKLQTISYQKYAEGLPNPSHLTLFKVEPLKGVCLLDMSPRLGLTIVDRLLGGPAHSVASNGELSEIETALLDQVEQIILNEWCQLWPKTENARPVLLSHENSGRFLNSSPHDSVMLILSMEVRLGDCVEQMQLAFPFHTIEPLVRQPASDGGSPGGKAVRPPWNPTLDEVPVRINTQWQGLELTAAALSTLKRGDVLMLEQSCFEHVEVRLEQLPKFYGRLGTSGDQWAVELTEVVRS